MKNSTILKIKKTIFENKIFIILFILAAIIRYLYLKDNTVPFLFDHGKDSLAILHMLAVPELKFIGPWTSIPGLYFGPAWYYLLAPFYLLSGYNPASGAVAMSILVLLQMYLVYKYFNIESSAIVGFSGFWLMMSKSAWNPFPMTLLSIIILILLLKQLKLKKIDNKLLAGLAFTASFGFHFSSAFAIFYPIIILSVFLLNKLWPNIKNILVAFIAFIIPFFPQILFEFKNGFPQYHAIINYFTKGGGGDGLSVLKIQDIVFQFFGQNRLVVFDSMGNLSTYASYIFLIFIFIAIFVIYKQKTINIKLKRIAYISLLFYLIPFIGFLFLHFNLWYVYPIVPITTILVGTLVHELPKKLRYVFILLYIITAILRLDYYLKIEKPRFISDSGFYPVKKAVIEYIRQDAGDKDFSVYTYKPDIYDFPYQYEFLVQGLKGKVLPQEFAYEPNVVSYVKEKNDLLETIDNKYGQRWRGEPQVIYYIVTEKKESELLGNWWGRQKYSQIVAQKEFGDRLVVYTATPIKE